MQVGHNRLRSFVERVERIREEIDALNADVSEIYKEAKNEGWDVKAMKMVIAERQRAAKDPAKFQELNAIIELYRTALESGTDNATRVRAHEMTNSTSAAAVPPSGPAHKSGGAESSPAPSLNHSAGDMTAAGKEGEGDGSPEPRTPEPTEMIPTQSARSGGLHVEDDLALPAFLDRRSHA